MILIILILLLLSASAFFSLTEIAFFSLSSSKIRTFAHSVQPRKLQVAVLIKRSRELLVTIFLLNTIANIALQDVSSDLFSVREEYDWILKVGVPLVLVLLFGELLPKYFGLLYNEQVSCFAAPFYEWFQGISTPLRRAIMHVANFFSRIIFFSMKVEKPMSSDELEHLFESSEQLGIIHKKEAELLESYLALKERLAKDIMTPRSALQVYDIEDHISKLIFLFANEDMTVVPVCKESLDHFLGMVSSRDFLIHKKGLHTAEEVMKLVRKPHFVPETTPVQALQEQFEEHIEAKDLPVMVVDEYGEISGMLTKQNLYDEVVATQECEQEEGVEFEKVGKDTIIAKGTMPLHDVSELFEQELESDYHSVTIGGWLIEKLGTIPQSGATFQEGSLFFRVLSSNPKRIYRIYIQRK